MTEFAHKSPWLQEPWQLSKFSSQLNGCTQLRGHTRTLTKTLTWGDLKEMDFPNLSNYLLLKQKYINLITQLKLILSKPFFGMKHHNNTIRLSLGQPYSQNPRGLGKRLVCRVATIREDSFLCRTTETLSADPKTWRVGGSDSTKDELPHGSLSPLDNFALVTEEWLQAPFLKQTDP